MRVSIQIQSLLQNAGLPFQLHYCLTESAYPSSSDQVGQKGYWQYERRHHSCMDRGWISVEEALIVWSIRCRIREVSLILHILTGLMKWWTRALDSIWRHV